MNSFKKLIITTCFILTISFLPQLCFAASEEIIYEKRSSEIISTGVTHESIQRFLPSGWLNINVFKVDLQNPYVKLDIINSPNGIGSLANVKAMAQNSGAVAAINSDFFDKFQLPGIQNGGYPISFASKNGTVISSAFYNSNTMATFSLDSLKQPLFSYVTQSITITSPNNNQISISDINKISTSYKYPIIYNKYWGKNSIGATEKFPDMIEIVVNDDVVQEIRIGQPLVEIPQNGYVICARNSAAKFFTDNFVLGDPVKLDIKVTPDILSSDFSISGSTLLLKDGAVAPFTHNITGSHPRSAIGVSKDKRFLYLVGVDGRQTISQGLTLDLLASLMLEIGAYDALNFDGGGSTQMVGRTPGTNKLDIINSPSESPLRKESNGIGVFSTAPTGQLSGLIIDGDPNLFVNTIRKFTVRGYDEHFNPIEVDPTNIHWKVSRIKGSFEQKSGLLTCSEVGDGIVTAKMGKISASIPISVLSWPVEMHMYPNNFKANVGDSLFFTVKGKNKFGYSATIEPSSLRWNFSNNIAALSGNTIVVSAPGSAIISCSMRDVTAYGGISAADQAVSVSAKAQQTDITFKGYPAEVTGTVATSSEQVHSGSSSYKLTYDFTGTDATRAAYIVFPDKSIPIDNTTTDFGVWVYNPSPKAEWLRAQINGADGAAHLVDIIKDLSWTGWKFIKVPISDDITTPAQISRIYVVQTNSTEKTTGEIYIDDITLYGKKSSPLDVSSIPANKIIPDFAQKEVKIRPGINAFQFTIMGNTYSSNTLLGKLYNKRLNQVLAAKQLYTFISDNDTSMLANKKAPIINIQTMDTVKSFKNSTFITLDDSNNGIRKTNASQWKWLRQQLENTSTENLFILMPKPVSDDNFTDTYEKQLLQDILSDYKKNSKRNVWVITGGSSLTSDMENGVRYVTVPDVDLKGSDLLNSLNMAKYMVVTVNGKEITYTVKSLF
jgi:hypothetical protein